MSSDFKFSHSDEDDHYLENLDRGEASATTPPTWFSRILAACKVIFLGLDPSTGRKSKTTVTRFAVIACSVIFLFYWGATFLSLNGQIDNKSVEPIFRYLVPDATMLWKGAYWGLITSVFVHIAPWHLAFNIYWLWVLGSRMESAIGSRRFLVFFLVAAIVSSVCEVAFAGATGIGISGVVYAFFGFMVLTRQRYPEFNTVLERQTISAFLAWLVLCWATTQLKVWNIGNAAHVSGMVFGGLVAGSMVLRDKHRVLYTSGLAAVMALSIIPLFWCPWSNTWLGMKANDAYLAGRYREACDLYTRIIDRDPQATWALYNRGYAYKELGDTTHSDADIEQAHTIELARMKPSAVSK